MAPENSLWAKETLEYSDHWFYLGIVTDEMLRGQRKLWSEVDADRNPEHYRYAAWRTYWSAQTSISDRKLELCIALALTDPDPPMGSSILGDMLKTSWLSDDQFDTVRRHANSDWLEKAGQQNSLIRSLAKDHSFENLDRVVRLGDAFVQRHAIDRYPLDFKTLEFLAQDGSTRAIRMLAKQQLKQR